MSVGGRRIEVCRMRKQRSVEFLSPLISRKPLNMKFHLKDSPSTTENCDFYNLILTLYKFEASASFLLRVSNVKLLL